MIRGEREDSYRGEAMALRTDLCARTASIYTTESGNQHAALICEAGHEAAHRIGRELRHMRRNDAPRALHHELHQECSEDQQRRGRRDRPTAEPSPCAQQQRDHDGAPPPEWSDSSRMTMPPRMAPTIEIAAIWSAATALNAIALEERGIHVLRAVRDEVHHRHQQRQIEE